MGWNPLKDASKFVNGVIGDLTGSTDAVNNAVNAQTQATKDANQLAKEMFDTQRADLAPWREAGSTALGQLTNEMNDLGRSFTASDMMADPGYQFRMDEGQKALERSAAARGGLMSGATGKALMRYGQDFASNEYNNAYNRFNNDRDRRFNQLASVSGLGQTTSSQLAGMAGQYGQQVGSNLMGLGNAIGAANMAGANMNSQIIGQGVGGGMAALVKYSDERLKTNVRPVSKEDLDELRRTIKPYVFDYINSNHGDSNTVGVMAQDLEKTKLGRNIVKEDSEGNKYLDLGNLLSMVLATYAEVK